MSRPPLAHRIDGDGPAALLLNGGLMTMAAWEPLVPALVVERRLLRCDLSGQLLSPGPPPPTVEGHLEDLTRLLDALGLGGVDVLGTSFGALVGLLLAARRPERVRSLVVASAAERISDDAWKACLPVIDACEEAARGGDGGVVFDLLAVTTFSPRYRLEQGAALRERRSRIGLLPPRWFEDLAALLRSLRDLDLRPALPAIRCPTLVLAAERDETFPPERSRALAAGIPGARLVTLAGCGHAMVVESVTAVATAVREFWSELPSQGAPS